MDGKAFDRLTKGLGTNKNRRAFGKGVIAAALAGVGIRGSKKRAEAMIYMGPGAPCADDSACMSGLICCPPQAMSPNGANVCLTTGDCGVQCHPTDYPCPSDCAWGDGCVACCEGYCRSTGMCGHWYSVYEGGQCSLSDPDQCAPGLTCCPNLGVWGIGTCTDSCADAKLVPNFG